MAKVTGPLYSMTASGKIADAMVFFSNKGRACVRQWLIPKNAKTEDQGDNRQILGGTGRACGAVKPMSGYDTKLRVAVNVPNDQTKQSYLVKTIIKSYLTDATAFEAMLSEFNGHTSVALFNAAAIDLGLVSVAIPYRGTTNSFSYGLQLYLLAKLACDKAFAGAPYTTALASWVGTQVDLLVSDLAAPV